MSYPLLCTLLTLNEARILLHISSASTSFCHTFYSLLFMPMPYSMAFLFYDYRSVVHPYSSIKLDTFVMDGTHLVDDFL